MGLSAFTTHLQSPLNVGSVTATFRTIDATLLFLCTEHRILDVEQTTPDTVGDDLRLARTFELRKADKHHPIPQESMNGIVWDHTAVQDACFVQTYCCLVHANWGCSLKGAVL